MASMPCVCTAPLGATIHRMLASQRIPCRPDRRCASDSHPPPLTCPTAVAIARSADRRDRTRVCSAAPRHGGAGRRRRRDRAVVECGHVQCNPHASRRLVRVLLPPQTPEQPMVGTPCVKRRHCDPRLRPSAEDANGAGTSQMHGGDSECPLRRVYAPLGLGGSAWACVGWGVPCAAPDIVRLGCMCGGGCN